MARWAAFIKRQAKPEAAWLTVDCGNYVDRVGTGGCSNKCQFAIYSYKELHYDVLNIGKQEVWMGYEALKSIMDTTQGTQFVSANLLELKSKKPFAKPYVVKDYGTMKVGVLGLLNEADFPKGSAMLDTTRFAVMPAIEAAKKYIPSLARKVDAVVLLADLPTNVLDSLVKIVPEIDVVISAGALKSGENPATVGRTRIVGPGSSGYNGHYAMLEFNPSWGDSIGFANYNEPLTGTYDEAGLWATRLAAFEAQPQQPPTQPKTTPTQLNAGPQSVTPGGAKLPTAKQPTPAATKPAPTTNKG